MEVFRLNSGIIGPTRFQQYCDAMQRGAMAMYRVFPGDYGESHIEDLNLDAHPELGSLTNISEVKVQKFDGSRDMPLHPLPERRLIIHLSGEVEITTSDGAKQVFKAGDVRLMDDVTGKGHAHLDLTPSEAVYIIFKD
jgi:redox-sensitive bicupin YhaK (pirin superfamily)